MILCLLAESFVFDDVEDELGVGAFDVGDGEDAFDEGVEVAAFFEVGEDHGVPVAGDIVNRLYMGVFGDGALDFEEFAAADLEVDDGGEGIAELFDVDDGGVAADEAGFLQVFDMCGDGGEADVEASGDVTVAFPTVCTEFCDDAFVKGVHEKRIASSN